MKNSMKRLYEKRLIRLVQTDHICPTFVVAIGCLRFNSKAAQYCSIHPLLIFDSIPESQRIFVLSLAALPLSCLWKYISKWAVIRPTKLSAAHLQSWNSPTIHLLDCSSPIRHWLVNNLFLYPPFDNSILFPQPDIFFCLYETYYHSWFSTCRVICYLADRDSDMCGNPEQLNRQ